MLNVNAFVLLLLLCLEPNSRRIDTAEINNFIVWPNDDIRTVAMSTENYGLAVACFQVYYGITKYTQYNILYAYIYESYLPVLCDSSVSIELTQYLFYQAGDWVQRVRVCQSVGKHAASQPQVSPTSRISHSLNPETLSSLPVRTKVPQV